MDFLGSLPIRTHAVDTGIGHESDNERYRLEHNKQKRATASEDSTDISIEIEEEEEQHQKRLPPQSHKKPRKDGTALGLNLQDDYFEVEAIQKRPLPREDGLEWEFWDQTAVAEAKRPYGKKYLQDQAERQKNLSHDKNYRFANLLAGSLRKELADIVDPEDWERLNQERATERMQTEIELKRTRVDMDKKYDLIQKLKSLLADTRRNTDTRRQEQVPYALRVLSQYLIDHEKLAHATTSNQYFGFVDLIALANTYGATNEEGRLVERNTLIQEHASGLGTNSNNEALELFFYMYVYYRDFLNNESAYTLRDSLTQKLTYALDNYNEITGDDLLETVIKKEPGEISPILVATYEQQLDRLGFALSGNNPLRLLDAFYATTTKGDGLIDWGLYKRRQTETINMTYFELIGISRELEGKMARIGVLDRYGYEYPLYSKQVIAHLYGATPEERRTATQGHDGLNLVSDSQGDVGGHPPDISGLIEIQYPRYRTEKPVPAIEMLLRAHFLWLFFDTTPWSQITALLMPEEAIIVTNIRQVVAPLAPILSASLLFYKALVIFYLRRVAEILYRVKNGAEPVIALNPQLVTLLFNTAFTSGSDFLKNAAYFDRLNTLLKGTMVRDLVQDPLFYEYLTKGSNAFLELQYGNIVDPLSIQGQGGAAGSAVPPKLVMDPLYPALLLHTLIRIYDEYGTAFQKANTDNVARIEAAIQKATKKMAEVVGDESYSLNRNNTDYRQRKSFTTRPENSGFVKMRSEIVFLLQQTYHLVMDYCPNLRGLTLEAFQSDSAFDSGLAIDFITMVAVLAADREFTFPDGYRSGKQFTKIKHDKQFDMARLRLYVWEGGNGRPYVFRKDNDRALKPFFACGGLGISSPCYYTTPVCSSGGNTRSGTNGVRLMF